jgi:uncharacterized protein YndB with AHSA1/START domain
MPAVDQLTEFTYTTYIKTTPEQLWQAITDPAFTRRYWGVGLISEWTVGSTITWEVADISIADPAQVVLIADPPRQLSYTWHTVTPEFVTAVGGTDEELAAMSAENRSTVTFDLEPAGGLVKFTVSHTGFEPGSMILSGVSNGWPSIFASLKTLLETGEPLAFD